MCKKGKYILVLGSLNADIVTVVGRRPSPGETIFCESYSLIPGGKGANQAATIAKLGGKVLLAGKVGADFFGGFLKENLKQLGVDIDLVQEERKRMTGLALITVDKKGENSIIVIPGANQCICPGDVNRLQSYLQNACLLLLQLEIPLKAVTRALSLARKFSVPVILDPGPARKLPASVFPLVSFLLPNEQEARILSGIRIKNLATARQAAKTLLGLGTETVLVKLGGKGCLVATKKKIILVPAFPVKAVDSTAAGDAFAGAFALALASGKEVVSAVRFASAAAAISVTRLGAQTSLPGRQELENFLRERNVTL